MVHQRLGVWQKPTGRRRVLGLFRAGVLVLFLLRHHNAQHVAAELFGCSPSTVSRRWRALKDVVVDVLAELADQVTTQESRSGLLVDGFIAPTGNREGVPQLFSGKRHVSGFNVQAVTNLDGRIVLPVTRCRAAGTTPRRLPTAGSPSASPAITPTTGRA
jgi:hypothetical protein